jgi:hypothetical protein
MIVPSALRPLLHAAVATLLVASGTARAEAFTLAFEQAVYTDGSKDARPLSNPQGVACSDQGAVVVADSGNQRLLTYGFRDGRLAGGAEVKLAQLTYPVQLQLDSKGVLVALDGKTRALVRVDSKGAFQGAIEPRGAEGRVVIGAFALDAADGIFALDVAGRRVLALDGSGAVKRQVALPRQGTFTGVAVDSAGTIYVVDAVAATVWSAEKAATAFKALTKPMKDKMSFPTYLLARKGRLYLVDQNGNGVVALGIDGSYQGRQLTMGWSEGTVYYPAQLCLTDAGQVFLADRYNNRVQYFNVVK